MVANENFNLTPNDESEDFTLEFGEVVNVGGGGGTSDFNQLTNRPKYNDQAMTGSTNIPAVPTKTSDLDNDSDYQTGSEVESAISSAIADKQDALTAGDNITIEDNTISATDTTYTAGANVSISDENVISATDTTYSNFTGTDGNTGGTSGLVPAPATTDAGKFLKADGTWDTAGGGGPTVVQTTGNSQTDVMSQDATTKMVYNSSSQLDRIRIGQNAQVTSGSTVAIGESARVNKPISVAIGYDAHAGTSDSVALGSYSETTKDSQIHIGVTNSNHGYNNTYYRLLSGLYDGQDAHDAVTVGQVNATIDAINTALGTSISHIGA